MSEPTIEGIQGRSACPAWCVPFDQLRPHVPESNRRPWFPTSPVPVSRGQAKLRSLKRWTLLHTQSMVDLSDSPLLLASRLCPHHHSVPCLPHQVFHIHSTQAERLELLAWGLGAPHGIGCDLQDIQKDGLWLPVSDVLCGSYTCLSQVVGYLQEGA